MAGQQRKNQAPMDLKFAVGTAAANGDNTLITASAKVRFVLVDIQIQNESAVATTAQLKGIAGGAFWRFLAQFQGDGFSRQDAFWPLDINTSLVLNLSGANSFGYSISYYESSQ